MTRALSWIAVGFLTAWALPAAADIPNDDCGTKDEGDACETYSGETGVCVRDEDDALSCDTEQAPDAGSNADGDGKKDDGGCNVRTVGFGGKGELAALSALLLVCFALRKRIR